jgi:hypothetical protein
VTARDIDTARRLLEEAEQNARSISNTADRARTKALIAQGWCQVAQADRNERR